MGKWLLDPADTDADPPALITHEVADHLDNHGSLGTESLHLVTGGAFEPACEVESVELAQ